MKTTIFCILFLICIQGIESRIPGNIFKISKPKQSEQQYENFSPEHDYDIALTPDFQDYFDKAAELRDIDLDSILEKFDKLESLSQLRTGFIIVIVLVLITNMFLLFISISFIRLLNRTR